MKIGIDISQTAFLGTGVGNFVFNTVEQLIKKDKKNVYVLFFSSLRRNPPVIIEELLQRSPNVSLRSYKMPPMLLDIMWNRLHQFPIELFVGDVDVFITSDWTEPPARNAKKVTVLYDLIIYKTPNETSQRIRQTQIRKLHWVKKESKKILCISKATKEDAKEILGIEESRLSVVHPGI